MWETVLLTGKEQIRLVVLNRVLVGDLTAADAAAALALSVRQVRRLLAAYRKEGAAALAHGNARRLMPWRRRWGSGWWNWRAPRTPASMTPI
jgi:helix-turn-helix protein